MSFMSMFGPSLQLRGDYAGTRDYCSVRYKFRFCDDGTYFYLVERGDDRFALWRLCHKGRWSLKETGRGMGIVRLDAPKKCDLWPEDSQAISLLYELGLPTNKLTEYRVTLLFQDNPSVQRTELSFTSEGKNSFGQDLSANWCMRALT